MALVYILIGSGARSKWTDSESRPQQPTCSCSPTNRVTLSIFLSLCPYYKLWVMPRRSWDSYSHHELFIRLRTQRNPMVQLITAITTMIKSHVGHLFFVAKTEENLSFSLIITRVCLTSFCHFEISVQVECDAFSDSKRIYFSFRKQLRAFS